MKILHLHLHSPDTVAVDGVDNSAMIMDGEESKRDEMVYHINEMEDPFLGSLRYIKEVMLCI